MPASRIGSRTSRPAAARRSSSSAAGRSRVWRRSATSRRPRAGQAGPGGAGRAGGAGKAGGGGQVGRADMRTPFIAGNWKMFKTVQEAVFFVKELRSVVKDVTDVEIVVAPPFTAVHA